MVSRVALLWFALVVAACDTGGAPAKPAPKDTLRPHDDTSHDENHYYVAVGKKAFDPPTLEVEADREIILLFDRRPDTSCSRLVLKLPDGPRTVELASARPTEVHVRLESGAYAYTCISGTMRGTIKAN
jgi:hypothetical protein